MYSYVQQWEVLRRIQEYSREQKSYRKDALLTRGTGGEQEGYSRCRRRVQEGYRKGIVGVQEGYSRSTDGIQWGYRKGTGTVQEGCRKGTGGVQYGVCNNCHFIYEMTTIGYDVVDVNVFPKKFNYFCKKKVTGAPYTTIDDFLKQFFKVFHG